MDHTVENKHFPGVFEATPLRAPVRPWGHAPRQANPVLTQGRRGAQGRDTPPSKDQAGASEVVDQEVEAVNLMRVINKQLQICLDVNIVTLFC